MFKKVIKNTVNRPTSISYVKKKLAYKILQQKKYLSYLNRVFELKKFKIFNHPIVTNYYICVIKLNMSSFKNTQLLNLNKFAKKIYTIAFSYRLTKTYQIYFENELIFIKG